MKMRRSLNSKGTLRAGKEDFKHEATNEPLNVPV